ncbi:MAG: NADP-dependent phosphogluconate dehydrogenase, partial [Hyphomicrobiales bacterium]
MPADFGIIGLRVMGRNLALNVEEHGFCVAVWNRTTQIAEKFVEENRGKRLIETKSLDELVKGVKRPRRIMLMIEAGRPVDLVIMQLRPLLERGDILIDGGNSWFKDTQRRSAELTRDGINYFGSGVSGGELGARFGPSLMPGGPR